MIKLADIIYESIGDRDFEHDYYEIRDEVENEWQRGQKHQSWRLIPARDLIIVWNTYAKYGRVNEEKLDKIWDIIKECAIKIMLNSDWWNHGMEELFGKDSYDELTRDDFDRFATFMSDRSGSQLWRGSGDGHGGMGRYSDVAKHLYNLLMKGYSANIPEEKLFAIDQILNVVHGSGAMAKWFVEGGVMTLNKLRDFDVKGIVLPVKENI
jgi:MoaA/NifB/PqqE/SkfB family radical SAM enzyme